MNTNAVFLVFAIAISLVMAQQQQQAGFVRHIVTFRFNETVTAQQQAEIMSNYTALKDICTLPNGQLYIVSFEGGIPNSREGFQQQMQQAYIVSFKNIHDRDYFVGRPFTTPYDPHHDAFKKYVGPFLRQPIETGLIVIDFTVL